MKMNSMYIIYMNSHIILKKKTFTAKKESKEIEREKKIEM